jgi:subtilisin family serine protease
MAETPYIVLRSQNLIMPSNAELGAGGRSRAFRASPEIMEVAEATLTKAERDDLRRDPRTRAIAKPMPMKLIAPVQADAPAAAAATNVTWGVEAVRAPASPFTGSGITVAVLDTGIAASHPAFQGVN